MNIEELLEIIGVLGGQATVDDICKVFQKKWGMYPDSSFKTGIQNILAANPDKVMFNKLTKKWEVGTNPDYGSQYLRVDDGRTFDHIKDVMTEVFSYPRVKPQTAYFDLGDGRAVWFPKFNHRDWDNQLSADGRYWYERDRSGKIDTREQNLRIVFAFDKKFSNYKKYRFTGVFKDIELRDDGTRVMEIVDDKIPIKGKKFDSSGIQPIIVCNITYMKFYNGITEEDQIVGGGGKYPTENKDGGEKFNFHINEDNMVRGFVETNYVDGELGNFDKAKKMALEKIDPSFKGLDIATGVRVVFISKGPFNKKNIVIGWYDNAKVYRTRQKFGDFGFNLECSAIDAHLIPEEKRTFEYPKINEDGSYNFGESNVSYPISMNQPSTNELITELNAYLASLLEEVQNVKN